MPSIDLDDDEHAALARLLKETIAADPYPLSPRLQCLKRVLAKIDLPAPAVEPYRAVKPVAEPSSILRKKRRR